MKAKVLLGLYTFYLLIPAITVYKNLGGARDVLISSQDLPTLTYAFVRLFALYGISLLFIQIILGSNMIFFMKIFGPKILKFHIIEGIIAYFIILSHPLLFTLFNLQTIGISGAIQTFLVSFENDRQKFMILGKAGLLLLTLGVSAGIFRQKIGPSWRNIHRVNYIVFPLILIHSWLIGTDSRTTPFVYLYIVFIIGYSISAMNKIKLLRS